MLPKNRLLALLPTQDFKRLSPYLEQVSLDLGQMLQVRAARIQNVYFPEDCVISWTAGGDGSGSVETCMAGREGAVSATVLLGRLTSPADAHITVAGRALLIEANLLRKEFGNCGSLHDLTLRFSQALFAQVLQRSACNRLHLVKQRLAKRLLMLDDRLDADEIPQTQEHLSAMLGASRTSVTDAACYLHKKRLISYNYGKVRILDRKGLEQTACNCYKIVRDEYLPFFH